MRKDINKHPSQEPEILPGTSNQGHTRRSNPPKQKSSRKTRVESDRTRETRPSTNRGHSAAEDTLQRTKRTTGVWGLTTYHRTASGEGASVWEALDGDPADRST
ncbi:hypothetical protein TNCV_811931 [Trichonephila clavipes]|nr:hypothetical protein TNCV_811931 [Trichonephila clavipes]